MSNIRERFLNVPLSHDNQSILALAKSGNVEAQAAIHSAIYNTPGFFKLILEAVKSHAEASGYPFGKFMMEYFYRTCDIWREIDAENGVYFDTLPRRPDSE